MLRIGQLARRFGLSRTALLYYDELGLLHPSERTPSGYRLYADEEVRRLEQICAYRSAGVPLGDIRRILESPGDALAPALERRFEELDRDISRLRNQQAIIVRLLRRPSLRRRVRGLDKRRWVRLLRAAGLDDRAMQVWHQEFERLSPRSHQDFLEALRIPAAEIAQIRAWSRRRKTPKSWSAQGMSRPAPSPPPSVDGAPAVAVRPQDALAARGSEATMAR